MRGDELDAFQALGLLTATIWPCVRGLMKINSRIGYGLLDVPSPYRPDTKEERRNRKVILGLLVAGVIIDTMVLLIPKIPGTKDLSLYRAGIPLFGLLALWHFLYLKQVIKVRTLWPAFMKKTTRFDIVKEVLVLRAHEKGERIPTDSEIQSFVEMTNQEFDLWLTRNA